MKTIRYAMLAVLGMVLLSACHVVSPKSADVEVRFDTVSVDTLYRLLPDKEHPAAEVRISLARPVGISDEALLPAVQAFVVGLVNQGAFAGRAGSHVERVVDIYVEDYLKKYKEDTTEALSNYEDNDNAGGWLNYQEVVQGTPLFVGKGLLSYQVQTYSYTGGAHGITVTAYGVMDLTTLSPLTLADLFQAEAMADIHSLVQQQLMVDNACETLEALNDYFFDVASIEATENFYVNAKGITWEYDPYEIAPYSMGSITVFLPWERVREFLLPDAAVQRLLVD